MIYTIYKISIADEYYIGSTRDLKQRKIEHKSACNKENGRLYNIKLYEYIRANGGWDCCDITPVEEFNCETKQQSLIREEYWRREYKALLNMKQAFRTEDEKQNNINKQNIKKNILSHISCECGGKYKQHDMNRHIKSKRHQLFFNK